MCKVAIGVGIYAGIGIVFSMCAQGEPGWFFAWPVGIAYVISDKMRDGRKL